MLEVVYELPFTRATNDGCLRMRVAGSIPVRNMYQVLDVRVGPCACYPSQLQGWDASWLFDLHLETSEAPPRND